MDEKTIARLLLQRLPAPDPRGSVLSLGPITNDWREVVEGPNGQLMQVNRGAPQQYGGITSMPQDQGVENNALAALRKIFEGERFRAMQLEMGNRDKNNPLYDTF